MRPALSRSEPAVEAGAAAPPLLAALTMLASPVPRPAALQAALGALSESEPAALLGRMAYHRIDGLAHRALTLLPRGSVGPWLGSALKRRRQKIAAATLSQGLALAGVLDAFHRRRIPVIVMRGLRSVEAIYGDPGSRPFQDHDLLVRATDRDAAADLLAREGFAQAAPGLHRRGGVIVDLHVDPLGASRRPTRAALFPLTAETIFERASAGTVAGAAAEIPSPEDEFLMLAIHAVKHSFDRLIRIADLAHALALNGRAICWETLRRRAEASGTARLLAWALQAACLLGVEPPADLCSGALGNPLAWALMRRVKALNPIPFTGEILMALSAPTLAACARFLMDALFPAGEVSVGVLGRAIAIPRRTAGLLRQAALEIGDRRGATGR